MKEWPIVSVEEIADPSPNAMSTGPFGSSIGSRFFRSTGVPVIRGSNLSIDSENRLSDDGLVFLDPDKAAEFSRSTARRGDLIFTCWGTINQVGLLDGTSAYDKYVISNKQMKFTPDRLRASPEYLYYLFSAPELQQEILGGAIGTSVPGFNLTRLKSIQFPLPSLSEQLEIARVLETAEQLISGLKISLLKKKDIRQGMLQELLTGRTRLPGSAGRWRSTTYGDLLRIQRGSMLTRAQAGQGYVPVIAGGKTPAGYTDKPNRVSRTITISASGANAGYVSIHDSPIFASDCSTIGASPKYDLDFVYYGLVLKQDDIYRSQTGGAQPHIHAKDIYPIEVQIPASLDEQRMIGSLLADVDTEIHLLERQVESARAIKQGMMQELLTGRTRLTTEAAP